jgi:MFS transporter, SET family, sugar efflux transporter
VISGSRFSSGGKAVKDGIESARFGSLIDTVDRSLPSSPVLVTEFGVTLVAFVLYFFVINWAPSVAIVLGAQLLRAIGIGFIGYQGLCCIQALMPNRVGSAATLFSNTTNAGFLFAGLAAGGWAQMFGYSSMFVACAALSGLGLLMLYFQSKITPAGEHAI